MSDAYQRTFRGYLIDHHSPAPPVVTLDKLSIDEYRAFFRTACISNLMVYCKDHWGYSYYDTQLGVRHPALKQDWVAAIRQVLREEGIEFNAYYCLEYDTLAPTLHPEWSLVDAAGQPVRLKGRMAKWGMPCYETGYRNQVLGQLREIVSQYQPDSLFLDIFGKSLCYCPSCRARFKREFGYDLPVAGTENLDEYQSLDFGAAGQDVNRFLENCAADLFAEIKQTLKAIDPTLKITINFAALYPKRIRDMLDYQFTEPWAGNWLSAAYSRDTARNQFPQLGPGDVSDVYNYRPAAIYRLAAAQIAAAGCRVFLYSGSQHVDGTLEHEEARRIGEAYAEIKAIEPWLTDRELVADVAIIQSDASGRARAGNQVIANAIGRCKQSDVHREAVLGAMTCCDAANLTWCVLPEQDAALQCLSEYRLVILAGVYHINAVLKEALHAYVRQGGTLLADGACGLYNLDGTMVMDWPLADLTGGRFIQVLDQYQESAWGAYLEPDQHDVWQHVPPTFLPTGPVQYGVQATEATAVGKIRFPATALTDTTWVNWWCPPPAAGATDFPALLDHQDGLGRVFYVACEFFRGRGQGLHLMQALFQGLIDQLLPDPSLQLISQTPEAVGFMAYQRGRSLIIHHLSHLAEKTGGEAPYIAGGSLRLQAERFPALKAAVFYPQNQELPLRREGIWIDIDLPPLQIHQLVVIDLEKQPD